MTRLPSLPVFSTLLNIWLAGDTTNNQTFETNQTTSNNRKWWANGQYIKWINVNDHDDDDDDDNNDEHDDDDRRRRKWYLWWRRRTQLSQTTGNWANRELLNGKVFRSLMLSSLLLYRFMVVSRWQSQWLMNNVEMMKSPSKPSEMSEKKIYRKRKRKKWREKWRQSFRIQHSHFCLQTIKFESNNLCIYAIMVNW